MDTLELNRTELLSAIARVVERLMHLGGADYEADKTSDKTAHTTGMIARDFGIEEWDWPQGVGLYGLCKLQKQTGNACYDAFFEKWFADNFAFGLPSRNINTTAPYLALLDFAVRTENKDMQARCLEHAEWLMQDLPKTEEGGFQHVTSAIGDRNGVSLHEGQIWADTLFMAVLFLNQAGQFFRRRDFVEESVRQFLLHTKYLCDKSTALFHHGWTFQGRNNFGGIFWCRGNAWFTYGLVDYLDAFTNIPLDEGVRSFLLATWRAQVDALLKLQDESGLWHTVLDDKESYCETSGSAAIAAGIVKGMRMGFLDESYRLAAQRAVRGICAQVDADGTVLGVSAGTGIGMDAAHYKNILIHPMAYGQSLALLALTEALA